MLLQPVLQGLAGWLLLQPALLPTEWPWLVLLQPVLQPVLLPAGWLLLQPVLLPTE